ARLDALRPRDDKRTAAARELGIEQEEGQAGEMIAVKVGDEDQLDVVAHDTVALQRRQRRGAAIDQDIDRRSRDMKAGVLPAAGAEGVAAADKVHLHRMDRLQGDQRPRGAPNSRDKSQIGITMTAPSRK